MEVGVEGGATAGAGADVGAGVEAVEVEVAAGGGAGAMARNLRLLLLLSSSWTYSSERGVIRRAVVEPASMRECLRFNTRVFDALRRWTSASPVAVSEIR